jgi:hypothetical protein
MSKNTGAPSAAQFPYYHGFMGMQHLFVTEFTADGRGFLAFGGPQPNGIQRKGAKTQRRSAAGRNQNSVTPEFTSELRIGN